MKIVNLLFLILLVFISCSEKSNKYRSTEGGIYATYYRITYESTENMDNQLYEAMKAVNNSLSMFDTASVVSRINRQESEIVDSLFIQMYECAVRVNKETKGAFDITVAPLVNAWGFGYKHGSLPTDKQVDSLRQLIGMDKLELREMNLIKSNSNMMIDASSIAKGLGVDKAAEVLEAAGVRNFLVDIGGEIRAKGVNAKGVTWRVGIDRPIDDPSVAERELQSIISFSEGGLATSGNYRNFYMHEGKKYAHTIDPNTGYPVQRDILSASVIAPTCMEADAFATSFMVLGFKDSQIVLKANPQLKAFLICATDSVPYVWMTESFEELIVR